MKNNKILLPAFILIILTVSIGCGNIKPIGKCTYGKEKPVKGVVNIVSIEKSSDAGKTEYIISVNGFFNRKIFLTEEKYKSCIVAKGLKTGSSLNGFIHSGGPCPPMYSLEGCD